MLSTYRETSALSDVAQESQEGREGTCGIGVFTLRSQQIFAVLPTEQIPILAPPHA